MNSMALRRIAIVTSACGAIGKAIARQLAERGYEVMLVGRDAGKLDLAAEEIRQKTVNEFIHTGEAGLKQSASLSHAHPLIS